MIATDQVELPMLDLSTNPKASTWVWHEFVQEYSVKTELNYKQCRALADKWMLLSHRSPEWGALMRAKFAMHQFVHPNISDGHRTYKELRHLLTNGQTPSQPWTDEINKLNYALLTQRLIGK